MTVATHDRRGEPSPRARLLEPESTGLKSQAPLRTRSELKNPMAGTYSVKEDQRRESEFRIALATAKRMLERSHRLEVPSNETNCGEDPHARKNDPDPPVPNVRCNHDHILAIRGDADIAVAVEVFVKARFEAHKKPVWQLVVIDLASNCCLEFKMKFESLLAINAAIEMGMNVLHGVGRQLAVDIRLKFV